LTSGDAVKMSVPRAKTLATAIHILSARAVDTGYAGFVREYLKSRAKDIAVADERSLQILDVVMTNAELTPEQVANLISRIDVLSDQLSGADRAALIKIREELKSAQGAVDQGAKAVRILHDRYKTEFDRRVREYQGLILELAQYLPASELLSGAILDEQVKNAIKLRVRGRDVVIVDGAAGGRGSPIRAAFGLPNPVAGE
jgi:hypothetical protein